MKYEIYEDGFLKWTIEASPGDITILPKSLTKGCSLSADSFDEIFYSCLTGSRTNGEAYEKAEQLHVEYFEKRKYSGYDSFLSARSKRLNK